MPRKVKIWCWLLLIGWSHSVVLFAQGEGNPFELKHRQKATASQSSSVISAGNPFDIIRSEKAQAAVNAEQTISANPFEIISQRTAPSSSSTSSNPFDIDRQGISAAPATVSAPTSPNAPPSTTDNSSTRFVLVIIMLLLLTLLFTLYRPVLGNVYRSFTNDNFLRLMHREQSGVVGLPYLLFYFNFFFNLSLFIYLLSGYFEWPLRLGWGGLFKILGLCIGLFLLKHFVLNLLGGVFPIGKTISQYNFTILIFSIVIGLLLAPINLIIAYSPAPLQQIALYAGLGSIGLIYLFRSARSLFLTSRFMMLHKFHFFMYICSLEIAPLVVLIKLLTNLGIR